MAQYNIDLAVAIKNSNKLIALRKELKAATDEQRNFNKLASEKNNKAVATFNKLNKQLSRAKGLLNKAAYGTDSFKRAAKALVNVEKEHNHQLREKEKLLNRLRMESDPLFQLKQQRKQQIKENIRQNRALRFTNVNPGRPAVVGDYGQAGGRIGPAQILNNSQGGFLEFSKVADKIAADVKSNVANTKRTATILSQQAAASNFAALGGKKDPSMFNQLGFGANASKTGPFAMPGGAVGRIKGGLGSAMIGGGFPLLFGQGGIGAAAGAAGGLLGGALSPGGGFAGSIVFTAVAQEIEKARKFRKEIGKLSKGAEMLGLNTNFSRKEIKALAKQFDLTLEESLERVREFKKFGGELAIGLAETFGTRETFNLLTGLINTETVIKSIVDLSEELGVNFQKDALNILALQGPLEANKFAIKETLGLSMKLKREAFGKEYKNLFEQYGVVDSPSYRKAQLFIGNPKMMEFLQKTKIPEIRAIMDNEESYKNNKLTETAKSQLEQIITPLIKDKEAFINALIDADSGFKDTAESALLLSDVVKDLNLRLKFVQEFNAPKDELTEMLNPLRRILDLSVNIRDGFEDSFKGIIKGTMSVSDAFRSMLNRIADYFLDYAARMSALGLQNMFLSIFNKQFTFDDIFERPGVKELLSEYRDKRANGGNVIGGKSYLVGERGPELFTPGATGTITANDAIGGTSVVVNVDASGTSVEGNQTNGEELGRLIGAVVQSELIKEKRPGGLLA